MKGIVFAEFLEMVEERFSSDVADEMIEAAQVPSGGAYTAVGTYDHAELLALVETLGALTGQPVPDLVRAFGEHLFGRFVVGYPQLFTGVGSAFAFLSRIEGYIHVEVKKLYPDAELPRFTCEARSADQLVLRYESTRPFADLAEGLMLGCCAHFGEPIDITRADESGGGGTRVRFSLTRRQPA